MREPEEEISAEALDPFVRDGRVMSYPRKWARRLELLRWLARVFEPGRDYSEAEVNLLLGGHEIDHATLRRYLVDAGLLERAHARYWRGGAGAPPAETDSSS